MESYGKQVVKRVKILEGMPQHVIRRNLGDNRPANETVFSAV